MQKLKEVEAQIARKQKQKAQKEGLVERKGSKKF
jgi:hypothetical protein